MAGVLGTRALRWRFVKSLIVWIPLRQRKTALIILSVHPEPEAFEQALRAAAALFARQGFHGASIEDLEAATGLSREELLRAFRDKEDLFYAAIDSRHRHAGRAAAEPEPLLSLLPRLKRANANAKLRSVHREAFARLMRLLQDADA
jgi:AcrR family transcriptional regulator